jgi:hypothetical protein
MPVVEIFSSEMQRIKSKAPASYETHVADTEKRLNILFDLLNNSDRSITEDIVNRLKGIAMAIQARDHAGATSQHTETLKALAQGSHWMVRPLLAPTKVLTSLGWSQTTDSNEQGYATLDTPNGHRGYRGFDGCVMALIPHSCEEIVHVETLNSQYHVPKLRIRTCIVANFDRVL